MPTSRILPDDPSDFQSMPSMPTMRAGGNANALGRIDHYDLLRKLGGGGFGVVYLALDTASGVEVALKTLHPLLKSNAEEMELLREKFALVSRLAHPNIATALVLHPVRDVNIWDETARAEMRLSPGDSVMVMRYAPGVTLSKWRRQFPDGIVPLDQALAIARQIASALDYAHSEHIVHRDIKPANIMVETVAGEESHTEAQRHGEDGARSPGEPSRLRVRILDFGLAAEIRSSMSRVSTEQGDTSGTRPYMAPEQWLGRKQDGRTDQYALACVLYELLSGAPPFAGVFETGDPVIMMTTVENRAPEEIDDIPAHVNAALQKALAKALKDRFSTCALFIEALAAPPNPESRNPDRTPSPETRTPKATRGGENSPGEPKALSESEILRRRLLLNRAVKAIEQTDRADDEFRPFVEEAELELAVAEDACKFGRFGVASESLAKVQKALDALSSAKAVRKAHEEAKRRAREEAERRAREEAERRAREEAERRAREEAERRSREESARKAREEAERKRIARPERLRKFRKVAIAWIVGSMAIGAVAFLATMFNHPDTAALEAEAEKPFGPRPGKPIPLGGGVMLEMVPCPDIAPDFWMGKYEVTQEQWERVMGKNPSRFKGPKNPVETVSWNDCQEFVNKLNALPSVRDSGLTFRLPTETEWETACRAGAPKSADYCKLADGTQITASTLSKVARYGKEWDDGTVPVGSFLPNAWGLYDMHGNVWEWTDTADGDYRVSRGGSFYISAEYCTAGDRDRYYPVNLNWFLGLRLAASGRTAASTMKPEAAVRVSDGKQAARSVAASRSETVGASSSSEPCVLDLGGGVMLEMVQCPGVAPDFWMGKYEVTQEQWKQVMGTYPSQFKGSRRPVESVSWNDCQTFIEKLNAMPDIKASGLTFRLPTEKEWETACRAGAPESADYCRLADGTQITASTLSKVARYGKGWGDGTVSVGSFQPNAWGLYDMHGNVWEWTDTAVGDYRVNCGGCFHDAAGYCTAGDRCWYDPDFSLSFLGLRLAASGRTAASTKEPEAAVRVSDGKQAARNVAASRSETVGASSSSEPCVLDLGGGVMLEMVQCPGVAPDFWMGKYEVTQEQWERVMGKNPSHYKGPKKPVESVLWNDCQDFLKSSTRFPPFGTAC